MSSGAVRYLAALFIALGLIGCGEPPPGPRVPTPQELVLVQLEQPVSLDVQAQPLHSVLEELARQSGLKMEIDRAAFKEEGVSPGAPVTCQLNEAPLRAVLNQVLSSVNQALDSGAEQTYWGLGITRLTYVSDGDNLRVTTEEAEWDSPRTKVYPIADLLGERFDRDRSYLTESDPALPEVFTENDVELLLRHAVSPETWEEVGGPGFIEVLPGALMVTQEYRGHLEIAATLEAWRMHLHSDSPSVVVEMPSPSAARNRINTKLRQPITLAFDDWTLIELCAGLSAQLNVPVKYDAQVLEDAGLPPTETLTLRLVDAPLGAGLQRVLEEVDLGYVVTDDALVITTIEEVETRLELRLYNLSDLLALPDVTARKHSEFVKRYAEESTWDDVGGPGTCFPIPRGIAVHQTRQVHREIEISLARLRAALDPSILDHHRHRLPESSRLVYDKLAEETTIEFRETPLKECLDSLKAANDLPAFWLDRRVLDGFGLRPDSPVTLEPAMTVSLHNALDMILHPLQLDWNVRDGVIVINEGELDWTTFRIGTLVAHRDKKKVAELIQLIHDAIAPQDWDIRGGSGSVEQFADLLVVQAGRDLNAGVARLLSDLQRLQQDDWPDDYLRATALPAQRRLYDALDRPVSVDIHGGHFREIVHSLAREHEVPLLLDYRSFDAEWDLRVDLMLEDRPLREVLDAACEALNERHPVRRVINRDSPRPGDDRFLIHWFIRDEVIWISDQAADDLSAESGTTRVHPTPAGLTDERFRQLAMRFIAPAEWGESRADSPVIVTGGIVVYQRPEIQRRLEHFRRRVMETRQEPPQSSLEEELAQVVSLPSEELPLMEVLHRLAEEHRFNYVIASMTEERWEKKRGLISQAKAKDVTLAEALEQLLKPHKLGWRTSGETLRVVERLHEDDDPPHETRFYDVGDIQPPADVLAALAGDKDGPDAWLEQLLPLALPRLDWRASASAEGDVEQVGNRLLVRQSPIGHAVITRALNDLRTGADELHKQFTAEELPAQIEQLLELQRSSDPLVRGLATLSLMQLPLQEHAALLAPYLQSPNPLVRATASHLLLKIDPAKREDLGLPPEEKLLRNLRFGPWQARVVVCQALAARGDKSKTSVEFLTSQLSSMEPLVAAAARQAVYQLKLPTTTELDEALETARLRFIMTRPWIEQVDVDN